jgi:hypothetical protein
MDPTIAAAIIAGVFAVLAAAVPLLLRNRRRKTPSSPLPSGESARGGQVLPRSASAPAPGAAVEPPGFFTLVIQLPEGTPEVLVSVNGKQVFTGGPDPAGRLRLKLPISLQADKQLKVRLSVPGFTVMEQEVAVSGSQGEVTARFEMPL